MGIDDKVFRLVAYKSGMMSFHVAQVKRAMEPYPVLWIEVLTKKYPRCNLRIVDANINFVPTLFATKQTLNKLRHTFPRGSTAPRIPFAHRNIINAREHFAY